MKTKITCTAIVLLLILLIPAGKILWSRPEPTAPGTTTASVSTYSSVSASPATGQSIWADSGKAYASRYTCRVSLDTEKKILSGTICATIQNNTKDPLKTVCLRNWASAILPKKQRKNTRLWDVRIGNTPLTLDTKGDGSILYASAGDQVLLAPGSQTELTFSFRTKIPQKADRFGYTIHDNKQLYQLTFCFPGVSLYQKGAWNENPYMGDNCESYITETADYDVWLSHPASFTAAATGISEKVSERTHITGKNLREFAVILSDSFYKLEEKTGDITISCYGLDYKANKAYYQYSLDLAKEAVELFSEKIGTYPFPQLTLVHGFMDSAMEYPGLCLIGMPDVKDYSHITKNHFSDLNAHVPHEIAHQWFYAAVGNDSYKEPWLDEGISEFCEGILFPYYADRTWQRTVWKNQFSSKKQFFHWMNDVVLPQTARSLPINYDLSAYQKRSNTYSECVYEGGKLFLYELWQKMGDDMFFQMLHKYYETYRFKLATTQDFLAIARSFRNDAAINEIIHRYISKD